MQRLLAAYFLHTGSVWKYALLPALNIWIPRTDILTSTWMECEMISEEISEHTTTSSSKPTKLTGSMANQVLSSSLRTAFFPALRQELWTNHSTPYICASLDSSGSHSSSTAYNSNWPVFRHESSVVHEIRILKILSRHSNVYYRSGSSHSYIHPSFSWKVWHGPSLCSTWGWAIDSIQRPIDRLLCSTPMEGDGEAHSHVAWSKQ